MSSSFNKSPESCEFECSTFFPRKKKKECSTFCPKLEVGSTEAVATDQMLFCVLIMFSFVGDQRNFASTWKKLP
jgi:hypothetical protein